MLVEVFQPGHEGYLQRLPLALLLTALFALAAYGLRAVTTGGALVGALAACLLYLAAGPGGFVALISVFVLAVAATGAGYERKRELGTAESPGGRTARQIGANLGIAGACAALAIIRSDAIWLLPAIAALAEAAGDTVASELGQATRARVYLISSGRQVAPGTDGGVSLPGTAAGALAAILIAAIAAAARALPWECVPIIAAAAIVGVMADSLLGALLQRRGLLNNDSVNLLGTVVAAAAALLLTAG